MTGNNFFVKLGKRSFFMKKIMLLFGLPVLLFSALEAKDHAAGKKQIMSQTAVVEYPCKYDNTRQRAVCVFAKGKEARPLLVVLHTWGGSSRQDCSRYAAYCLKNNWNMIYPEFRGPNKNPLACGSEAVVSDIADAVAYMKKQARVDHDRVYLIGGSGGGHAALLMAGRHPELWTAVSAWCPITDIAAWHNECEKSKRGYFRHIRSVCGGNPAVDKAAAEEAKKRSPLTWIDGASRCLVEICTGINDGHTGSVPVSHTLNAYNRLASPDARIPQADIDLIVQQRKIPEKYGKAENDPAYGAKKVLLRKRSNLVRMTVFDGGHDCVAAAGLEWLSRQHRKKTPDWNPGTAGDPGAFELAK